MAFPTIVGSNTSSVNTAGTSHTVNLPASIAADELLIILRSESGGGYSATTPSGWTLAYSQDSGTSIAQSGAVFWKKATGSEGSTVTITTSSSHKSAHRTYRITGHNNAVASASTNGTTGQPDSPNLAPGWGSVDILWISVGHPSAADSQTPPTNYGNSGLVSTGAGGTVNAFVLYSTRNLTASTENPGAYSSTGRSSVWASGTIGIQPGSLPAAKNGNFLSFF